MKPSELPPDYYSFARYVTPQRMLSYWHQIHEITGLMPKRVLEIGAGPGLVASYLSSTGIEVETVDSNPELHPTYVGSVLDLDSIVKPESYDLILCARVLHHINFGQVGEALAQVHRATKAFVVVTLPYEDFSVYLLLRYTSSPIFSLRFPLPIWIKRLFFWNQSRSGLWKIADQPSHSLNIVRNLIRNHFSIAKDYRLPEDASHYLAVLSKAPNAGTAPLLPASHGGTELLVRPPIAPGTPLSVSLAPGAGASEPIGAAPELRRVNLTGTKCSPLPRPPANPVETTGPGPAVVFDFDGTLTSIDTTRLLLISLSLLRPSTVVALLGFGSGYGGKVQETKNRMIGNAVRDRSEREVDTCLRLYRAMTRPFLRKRLLCIFTDECNRGGLVIVASATPSFAIRAIPQFRKATIVATEFEIVGGRYSGRLAMPNCYGVEKLVRIRQLLSQRGLPDRYIAYSDSLADEPLMKNAQRALWVHPDPTTRFKLPLEAEIWRG